MYKHLFLLLFILSQTLSSISQGLLPRAEIKLDQVSQQYNLTGEGVLLVIMDRGVDYRHPDFIDENGRTRIAYIYDMIDVSGANDPNNSFGIGTIIDSSQINQALSQNLAPLSTDRGGHGTATASIAGGNGSAVAGTDFQGVATKARFLIIKLTHDPFPAFGNQPGQAGFFNPSYLPVALNFAREKIQELQLPSITLLNLGSIGGPTDGTSLISREIDSYVMDGYPFVCGVGDDGGTDNHAAGDIDPSQAIELEIQKGEAGFLRLDLWYPESDRLELSIERPNGQVVGPYSPPTGPNATADQNLGDIFIGHRGANVEFFEATSDRRELLIDFSGDTGLYKVLLRNTQSSPTSFHASLNPSTYFNDNKFHSFVVSGHSINDYTSAEEAITPGDYVVKNEWTDVNGVFRDLTGQGEDGELWLGSSEGPTYDGRRGIDFVAPGEVCFAAYQPDTWYSNASFNLVQGGNSLYGIQNAVSAAAPMVTGVIALMLEINPNLTPKEIKTILQQASEQDAFTGSVPNETWGYGKLNALKAIKATQMTVNIRDEFAHSFRIYPNPSVHLIHWKTNHTVQGARLIDLSGKVCKEVFQAGLSQISISELPEGMYILEVLTAEGSVKQKVLKE